jgi:hypothetical protein
MPDQPPKTRRIIWLLSLAAAHRQLVWVECGYCRRSRRYYEPDDLKQLFGDVDVNKLARKMRCERCGRNDQMECDVILPPAAQRASMTIRRLVEIRVKRIPVWRDVKP